MTLCEKADKSCVIRVLLRCHFGNPGVSFPLRASHTNSQHAIYIHSLLHLTGKYLVQYLYAVVYLYKQRHTYLNKHTSRSGYMSFN